MSGCGDASTLRERVKPKTAVETNEERDVAPSGNEERDAAPSGNVESDAPLDDHRGRPLLKAPVDDHRGRPLLKAPVDSHRGRPLVKAVHTSWRCSPMSAAAEGTSYNGFLVLFIIVSAAMNLRLMMENLIKYGILITLPSIVTTNAWDIGCYGVMALCMTLAWWLERRLPPKQQQSRKILVLHIFNISCIFALPGLFVWYAQHDVLHGVILLSSSICYTFKTISFVHTAYDIRHAQIDGCSFISDKKTVELVNQFPDCVDFKEWCYFFLYPTLCFQLHYPRSDRVRKRVLFKQMVLLLLSLTSMYVLCEQYVQPLLVNARAFIDNNDFTLQESIFGLFERLLKLSIPNLYLWLLLFFALFHVYLSLLAEITRFGDRKFYDDWWNSPDFATYWSKWNLPIHNFLVRHMYSPLLRRGHSKMTAGFCAFAFSGILHEYVVCVPLHLPRPTLMIFFAFLFQVPLIIMTSHPRTPMRNHPTCGNVFFWIVFCFTGQPFAILMYFFLKTAPEYTVWGSLLSLR